MGDAAQRARSRSNSSYTAGTAFTLQMPLPPVKNLPPHLQALQAGQTQAGRAALGRSQELPSQPTEPLPKPPPRTAAPPVAAKPAASSNLLPVTPPRTEKPAATQPAPASPQRMLPVENRSLRPTAAPPVQRGRSNSTADLHAEPPQPKQTFETINATTRRHVGPRPGAERPISVATSRPVVPPTTTPLPPRRQPSPPSRTDSLPAPPPRRDLAPINAAAVKPPASSSPVRAASSTSLKAAAASLPAPPPRTTPPVPAVSVTPSPTPAPTLAAPQSPRSKQSISPGRPRPPVPAPSAPAAALPQPPVRTSSPQPKRPAVPSPPPVAKAPHPAAAPPTPSRGGRPNLRYQPALAEVNNVPVVPKIEPAAPSRSVFTPDTAGNVTEVYALGQTLGSGGFAEVLLGTHKKTQKKFAVKVIDKEVTAEADKEALATELRILKRINHPNVVKFFDFYDSPQKAYVVLELMLGGELLYTIEGEQANSNYTENDARRILRQILEAVGYLHSMKIVHRDLKPENMLFTEKGTNATLKLIDFGLAKEIQDGEMLSDWCGTPEFQAPEMIKRLGYNQKADVWSVGVILYILLAGQPPFRDNNRMRLYSKIVGGKYEFPADKFDAISAEARDLVTKLLHTDVGQRPTCMQALDHAWFKAATTGATTGELHKYTTSRRFQNTGKQLMNCQRFNAYSKEEAVQDQQARASASTAKQ